MHVQPDAGLDQPCQPALRMAGADAVLFQMGQTVGQAGRKRVFRIGRYIRHLFQDTLEIIRRGAACPAPKENGRSLYGADFLRDRGRDPLVERYAILLGESCCSRLERGGELEGRWPCS